LDSGSWFEEAQDVSAEVVDKALPVRRLRSVHPGVTHGNDTEGSRIDLSELGQILTREGRCTQLKTDLKESPGRYDHPEPEQHPPLSGYPNWDSLRGHSARSTR
jgi:hypothetical protein